jgi:hypothetical protein
VEELLPKIGNEAPKPSADSGFVDVKNAGDLKQGSAVKKIGSEQKTILGSKHLESPRNGMGEASKLCGNWRRGGRICGNVERIERSLTMDAAMVIHVPLRQRGAKPANE